MPQVLTVDDFLNTSGVLLDARSPGEFQQGHIPGAMNFPLFTNEERAAVGTCYKQQGQAEAIELGLELVGPKMANFVRSAKQLSSDRHVRLHCWRGGMRSGSLAWLLETAGFRVTLLQGGYKAFRQWGRSQLSTPRSILTLGGMTGTGKTQMLYALAEQGEQIIDLEALANHRGSSYGALGLPPQPTDEHFENLLVMQWVKVDPTCPVWIEAESRRVGICRVPDVVFIPMERSPIVQMERSQQERIDILLKVYGASDPEELISATQRIGRKLGGQHAKQAIELIRQGDLASAIAIVLAYYDKTYLYDLQRRDVPSYSVDVTNLELQEGAKKLIAKSREVLSLVRDRQQEINNAINTL